MLCLFFRIFHKIIGLYDLFQKFIRQLGWNALYDGRILLGKNFVYGHSFDLYFDLSYSKIEIGSDVQFRHACQVRTGINGKLTIGDRVFFNNHCSITCFNSISIGNDCQFGEGVRFYDHNHQYKSNNMLINEQGYSNGSITIGNNCWFGSGVIILKNVEIGSNVVIGAGCVIHKSIPANTVVVNKQNLVFTHT